MLPSRQGFLCCRPGTVKNPYHPTFLKVFKLRKLLQIVSDLSDLILVKISHFGKSQNFHFLSMFVCLTSFKSSGGTTWRSHNFFQNTDIETPCTPFFPLSSQTNLRKFEPDSLIQKKEVQNLRNLNFLTNLVLFH